MRPCFYDAKLTRWMKFQFKKKILVTCWWTSFLGFGLAFRFNVIWMEDFWRGSARLELSKDFIELFSIIDLFLVDCWLNLEMSINELRQKQMCRFIVKSTSDDQAYLMSRSRLPVYHFERFSHPINVNIYEIWWSTSFVAFDRNRLTQKLSRSVLMTRNGPQRDSCGNEIDKTSRRGKKLISE